MFIGILPATRYFLLAFYWYFRGILVSVIFLRPWWQPWKTPILFLSIECFSRNCTLDSMKVFLTTLSQVEGRRQQSTMAKAIHQTVTSEAELFCSNIHVLVVKTGAGLSLIQNYVHNPALIIGACQLSKQSIKPVSFHLYW